MVGRTAGGPGHPGSAVVSEPAPPYERGTRYRHVVDWDLLVQILDYACEIRRVSLRQAAQECGLSSSGFTRIRQGDHLSADGLAALIAWLFPDSIPRWIKPTTPQED